MAARCYGIGYGRPVEAAPIHSERLDLVSMSPGFLQALLDDRLVEAVAELDLTLPESWPDEHDAPFLRRRLEQMQADPDAQPWLVRALVLRRERLMIGHAGFHGPSGATGLEPGKVELGYTVFRPFRGRGYATEAALALMSWAEGEGIRRFVASVAPGNEPSLAIVRKLGFVQTGEQWDEEDGLELVFELERSS